ncbi:MAG: hypothetical protein HC915_09025 [Anaerolineae bacterium]|nr:hypothetical protein [Anaerolineae bacterium]
MPTVGLPGALVVAAVLACLPMILERQVIPWRGGTLVETFVSLAVVLVVTVWATRAAVPEPTRRPLAVDCLRVASLNIHGGYTTFFAPNLEEVADLLQRSGADVVLLQEVETGLLVSGSVDQAHWLADRLQMNVTFFPQNEHLQGLAVLSRLSVSDAEGYLLTSPGAQAAAQYVRYRLDENGDLHVYNAWLNYPLEAVDGRQVNEQVQDQVQQMNELYSVVARNHFGPQADPANPDRVVLGGSFNADESSRLYQIWAETVFEDPFATLFRERRNTLFPAGSPPARWDYLWLLNLRNSGAIIAEDEAVSNRRLSIVAVGREANQVCPTPGG